jgi:signal transduction histidine kinase
MTQLDLDVANPLSHETAPEADRPGAAWHQPNQAMIRTHQEARLSATNSWRWRRMCSVAVAAVVLVPALSRTEELTTAAAVRGLSVEQARQRQPVRLRGVVTFFEPGISSRFIQDESAGIYLHGTAMPTNLAPGDVVEVAGISGPGEYAPIVIPQRVRVLDKAPLPVATPVSYERLASGREDSQFVEVSGLVRSLQFRTAAQHYQLEVVAGGGRVAVYCRVLPVSQPEELLDCAVRVRGVVSTQFNRQRQLFSVRLMVPRPDCLIVDRPAPTGPFSGPARPIGSLLQFSPEEPASSRVRIVGEVTYFEPGQRAYLQEGDKGVEVRTRAEEPLQPGERVEAAGYVGQGVYTPVLQDAVFRRVPGRSTIVPTPLAAAEVRQGQHDCVLIRVNGRVLDQALVGPDRYLILQDGEFTFHAYERQRNPQDVFAPLPIGSRVAVVGICRIDPGAWHAGVNWRARGFRVELRSPADVTVLAAPPWWTLRRVFYVAAALALVAVAAIAWVAVLHRQVAQRTRALELEIQERQRAERRREIEQERTRVAQDLHDELGATLTEVGMLSSLAGTPSLPPENRERYLKQLTLTARAVVSTLDEIVWAVNPKYDSAASLASYYSLFAQRFLNLAGMACRLDVAESFPSTPLDSRVRHSLFLALKEALNNAVRHSAAKEVRIEMACANGMLQIVVADNGRGFEIGATRPGSDGLASMKARMEKLGGQCAITSQPGEGTRIVFHLPLRETAA